MGFVRRLAGILATAALWLQPEAALAQSTARFPDAEPARPAVSVPRMGSWATERARALTAKGDRYASRGDAAFALSAYNEAVRTDPTYAPAFLGLARVREAMADYGEAERVYQLAVQLPEAAPEAWARRASLYKRIGREQEALRALETSVRLDPRAEQRVRELASWYAELRAWPAALAVARLLASQLEADQAPAEKIAAARVQVQALSTLAADTDPVQSGSRDQSWVRRSLSRVARRSLQPSAP